MNQKNDNDSNWALVTPVDTGVEREEQGYQILEDKVICCGDCGKELVQIIMVQDADEHKRIKAKCPCGDESFIYEVKGKTFIQPAVGRNIVDMPMELDNGWMNITIEVI